MASEGPLMPPVESAILKAAKEDGSSRRNPLTQIMASTKRGELTQTKDEAKKAMGALLGTRKASEGAAAGGAAAGVASLAKALRAGTASGRKISSSKGPQKRYVNPLFSKSKRALVRGA